MKKITPRKLGDKITERIILDEDGSLVMKDGSSLESYLKMAHLMFSYGLKGTGPIPVCVIALSSLESLERDALLHRSRGA